MSPTQQASAASRAVASNNEFLTFVLDKDWCGINILRARKICGYNAVTAVANTPPFIKSVSTRAASSSPSSICASSLS